jgi:hypothetical protein
MTIIKPHQFIEEFLTEHPQEHFFVEVSLSMQDFMRAYSYMKNEGDIPDLSAAYTKNFQNYLFISFCDRTNETLKWIN